MTDATEGTEATEAIARYQAAVAKGERLLSAFRMRDVQLDVAGDDLAVELDVDEALTGPLGALQGGFVATLADIVGGRVAMAGLDAASIVVTSDLTVHYLAPVMAGPAHAVGKLMRRGGRAVVVRVDIYDGAGGPHAAACTVAFTVVAPKNAGKIDGPATPVT